MKPIRVLLVDDHELFRAGLRSLLESMPDVEVAAEAGDGSEALRLAQIKRPRVVLMDIVMPGLNGFEATARITKELPEVKVIILSMHTTREYLLQALRSGASGYLSKDSPTAELELALRAVAEGHNHFSPALSTGNTRTQLLRRMNGRGLGKQLTFRQCEVLQLIAEGKTTKEIAVLLKLSPKTVETHRTLLRRKLHIRDVPGLVRYAVQAGLVPPL